MLHKFNYQPIAQPILAADVVRFVGEPIAAVVASSPAEAEDIAEAVEIEIADLPRFATRKTHWHRTRRACMKCRQCRGRRPLQDRGFRRRRRQRRPRRVARSLPPPERDTARSARRACGVRRCVGPRDADLHHADAASDPHRDCRCAGFAESDLRVVAPDVGGGFGQKMSLPAEYVFLVWLARKLRGTVAWSEDRRENLIAAFHSRDQHMQLEGAFDAAGKLIALSADVVANIGAYSCFPTTCGVEPLMAMAELPGPYELRAYAGVARGVATHTCTMAPYRGVSRPVITFAIERLMDKAAAAFGTRSRRNPAAQSDQEISVHVRHRTGVRRGQLYRDLGASDRAGGPAKSFRAQQRDARSRGRYRGIGFATFSERTGYGSSGLCRARHGDHAGLGDRRDHHGPVRRRRSAHRRQPARARAAHHACPNHRRPGRRRARSVRIVHGDTDRTPYGWGTFASRSLVIAGGASLLAAQKIRKKLLTIASHVLEAAPTTSCSKTATPKFREPIARCRSRHWPAPPIIRPTVQRRDHAAA